MADTSPTRALNVVKRVETMCDFIGHPAMKAALEQVPVTMPYDVGALGLDSPFWVGLGTVGLWAALDAFVERAGLSGPECPTCGRKRCISARFEPYVRGNESQSLKELEDLRNLYAHNYAGDADEVYFGPRYRRHVLARGVPRQLTCGAQFDGHLPRLELPHLRIYAHTVERVLKQAGSSLGQGPPVALS